MKEKRRSIFTAVELGTSTIKIMAGEMSENGGINVIGLGEARSNEVVKGEVIKSDVVAEQFMIAIQETAKSMMQDNLERSLIGLPMFLVLSGGYIIGRSIKKSINLNPNEPISGEICEQLMIAIRKDIENHGDSKYVLLDNIVTRCFNLSNNRISFNPIGQTSDFLEVEVLYFLADKVQLNTILSVFDAFVVPGQIMGKLYAPLAVQSAIFPTLDNVDSGLPLVIDIGAGVTSIVMTSPIGSFVCEQITVGCEHIANDLAIGLNIPIVRARNLLRQLSKANCSCNAMKDGRSRLVEVFCDGEMRQIPTSSIEIIIEARLSELFTVIKNRLIDLKAYNMLGNEVVISGGGAQIPGICELAHAIFNRKASIARVPKITGVTDFLQPRHSAVIGCLRGCYHDYLVLEACKSNNSIGGIFSRALDLIKNFNS